jgi:hypothetical protein
MRPTYKLLRQHNACTPQADEFRALFPRGCKPTVDNLMFLANHEYAENGHVGGPLDVLWLARLLPKEGPGSMRAFALWCAEQVAHLNTDERVVNCLAVVRRRVDAPGSCTDEGLAAAGDAAWAAARAAAGDAAGAAAGDAARDAAGDAARDAARDAQIACLSQLLMEAP